MMHVDSDRDLVVILASHYDVHARRQVIDARGSANDVEGRDDVEHLQAALPLNVRVRTIVQWVDSAPSLTDAQMTEVKQIFRRALARRRASIMGGIGLTPAGTASPILGQAPADGVLKSLEGPLEQAAVLVVLLGTAFLVSPVGQESVLVPLLARAVDQGVVILPVVLDESALPSGLSTRFPAFGQYNRALHSLPADEQMRFWADLADMVSRASMSAPGPAEAKSLAAAPTTGTDLSILHGAFGRILDVGWSPDGGRIAAACGDSRVYLWDAHTTRRLLIYTGHTARVNGVAWSPDGGQLASVASGGARNVQVWDAVTGARHLAKAGHMHPEESEVVWLPDGQRLVGGQVVGNALSVAWSPDGVRLVTGGDDHAAQVWDTVTGERLLTYAGHADPINAVAWSPDGSRIASGGGPMFGDVTDPSIHIWDAQNGDHLLTYTGHEGAVLSIAWSPEGGRIASSQDGRVVQVWDARTATLLQTYSGHGRAVRAVRWSPDGTSVASCGDDGTVQVWDPMTGQRLAVYRGHAGPYHGATGGVLAVTWSPDSAWIALGEERLVRVWALQRAEQ